MTTGKLDGIWKEAVVVILRCYHGLYLEWPWTIINTLQQDNRGLCQDKTQMTYLLTLCSRVLPEKMAVSQLVKKFPPFYSLCYSQVPASCPYSESIRLSPWLTVWMFRYKICFYGEELLAPSPNPQAGGPPLAGCPRLFIQYSLS